MVSLISDVIDCQLGGAKISFWYYFTGQHSKLEVCTRIPPGAMDPSKTHCYDPVSNTRQLKWTFGSVELPPMTQSMEVGFYVMASKSKFIWFEASYTSGI